MNTIDIINTFEAQGAWVGKRTIPTPMTFLHLPFSGVVSTIDDDDRMVVGLPPKRPALWSEKHAWATFISELLPNGDTRHCALGSNPYSVKVTPSYDFVVMVIEWLQSYQGDPQYDTVESFVCNAGWKKVLRTAWDAKLVDIDPVYLSANIDTGKWVIQQHNIDGASLGYCYQMKRWSATPHNMIDLHAIDKQALWENNGWMSGGSVFFDKTVGVQAFMRRLKLIDPRYRSGFADNFTLCCSGEINRLRSARTVLKKTRAYTREGKGQDITTIRDGVLG